MIARLLATALLTASIVLAADEPVEKRSSAKDAMRAQMLEDAKKQNAKPVTTAPTPAKPSNTTPAPAKTSATTPTPAATATAPDKKENAPAAPAAPVATTEAGKPTEPATVLPKVEVNRSKLHPLARELYETEKELAREKQLTKSSELDKALNNPKVTLPLFGGQSTASRTSVASERAELIQAEADLVEEIGRANTKEQKAELRKQLEELKKVRRELEHAIR